MGLSTLFYFFLAGTQLVEGHSTFVRVGVNGQWQEPTRFIRNKTQPFEERDGPWHQKYTRFYLYPSFAMIDYDNSVRCGRDNMAHAADTDVLKVKAGDEIDFAITSMVPDGDYWHPPWTVWDDCPDGKGLCNDGNRRNPNFVYHPGPVIASLSKVPDGQNVREYDGSGQWVKIYNMGLERRPELEKPVVWLAWGAGPDFTTAPRMIAKLPKQTPSGQYLIRFDTIWTGVLTGAGDVRDYAQIYAACAQIEVESEYAGSLPTGVRIPEDMDVGSPGMYTSPKMYEGLSVDEDYVYPLGPLWDGETLVQDRPRLS